MHRSAPTVATSAVLLAAGLLLSTCVARATRAQPAESVVLEPVSDEMRYATVEITAKAGTELRLVMNNTATNPAMHHNVAVLQLATGDEAGIEEVGMAALEAGPDRDYLPEHEAVLAATAMAAPGERTEVTFTVPPPGAYPYVCLFPGHFATMRGVLHSVP